MNKPYILSCNSFLEFSKLQNWINENSDIVSEISKYADDIVYDTDTCVGKVGITIYHSTTKERNAIISIAKSIFRIEGIPYRLVNF